MINYYLITKPGIILGNLITVAAGFLLASKGGMDVFLFFATLIGLGFIIASACVLNNYIDRHIDKKMKRTEGRPLAKGVITGKKALFFALLLGSLGNLVLLLYTNLLTLCIANFGFLVYVLIYSFWKRQTVYATAIGSVSGGIPPLVGYCAVSNQFDIGALIFFMIMIFWQMPHFFSIAMYRLSDYSNASLPVFPIIKGLYKTKIRMIVYIVGFIVAASTLTLFRYTGYWYLSMAVLFGIAWLSLCLKGFSTSDDKLWARNMFRLSLLVIVALCIMIPLDRS